MEAAQQIFSDPGEFSLSNGKAMRAPTNLPKFQWVGYVWEPSETIFPSIHGCLVKFQDIVMANAYPIDKVWNPWLPILLSPEHRSWFEINLEPHQGKPWSFARD